MSSCDLTGMRIEEFEAMFDELEELEAFRTELGAGPVEPDAARRDEIERRLLALLTTDAGADERRRFLRIPCDLWIEVRARSSSYSGVIVDVGVGGALVETDIDLDRNEDVEVVVERQPGLMEHGLEVRGVVAWTGEKTTRGGRSFGVSFTASEPRALASLRRFLLALLRRRRSAPPLSAALATPAR